MMRLYINGRWEPRDFIETFEAMESLYYIALNYRGHPPYYADEYHFFGGSDYRSSSYEDYLEGANRWMLARARRVVPAGARLYVKRVEFASPGGIDFAGLGQATDAVDRLAGRLIDFFTGRGLRREKVAQAHIETEMMEQSLASLKIDNARKLLELRRDFPDDEHLIALAVRDQDKLADKIAQGLITGNSDGDEGP